MAIETAAHSRRALLTGAIGAAAALAAQAIGRPLSARAADTEPIIQGELNKPDSQTDIAMSGAGGAVLALTTDGPFQFDYGLSAENSSPTGGTKGIFANSKSLNGTGVQGTAGASGATTGSAIGVLGTTTSPGGMGVRGVASHATGATYGVYGSANSTAGSGVFGSGKVAGIYGRSIVATGSGVFGDAFGGHGVHGTATSGIGVFATATSSTGTALSAAGKVHFSRSGRMTVPIGTSSKLVTLTGVTTGSLIFAVLASPRTNCYVWAVVASAGSFVIYINQNVPSSSPVNWFVLD